VFGRGPQKRTVGAASERRVPLARNVLPQRRPRAAAASAIMDNDLFRAWTLIQEVSNSLQIQARQLQVHDCPHVPMRCGGPTRWFFIS
jgi:hypothetical protein